MSKLEDWSTTAASNDLAVPEGWPEGMSPGNVNNVGRQTMARVREWYQDAEWISLGHTINSASGDEIVLAGDVEDFYPVGRMLRADGTIGYVTAVSVSTNTTVEVSGITFAGAPALFEVGILSTSLKRAPGDFAVGGDLVLDNPPNIAVTGFVAGTASFDGHSNVSIATTIPSGSQRYVNQARGLVVAGALFVNNGITSITVNGTGDYTLTLPFTPIGANVTVYGSAPSMATFSFVSNFCRVYTFNAAGAAADRDFFVTLHGA